MGKYMKKSKSSPMEVTPKPSSVVSLGVKTRAKTLALKRLSTNTTATSDDASSFSYLQLRNRRLQKPPIPPPRVHNKRETALSPSTPTPKERTCRESPNLCPTQNIAKAGGDGCGDDCLESLGSRACTESGINGDFEKGLELDSRESERGTRESTPCSLVGDSEVTRILGSATVKTRLSISLSASMPSTLEIDEFFASAEQEQQRLFAEKYNFDIKNDRPLPGRFEWVKVIP